jgi:hypothetical protein
MKPAARLMAENVSFSMGATADSFGYSIVVNIGRDRSGEVVELAIV